MALLTWNLHKQSKCIKNINTIILKFQELNHHDNNTIQEDQTITTKFNENNRQIQQATTKNTIRRTLLVYHNNKLVPTEVVNDDRCLFIYLFICTYTHTHTHTRVLC